MCCSKKINMIVDIDTDDLIGSIVSDYDLAEDIIKKIDSVIADWDFTMEIATFFIEQMYKYFEEIEEDEAEYKTFNDYIDDVVNKIKREKKINRS